MTITTISETLRDSVSRLSFSEPVTHCYNPLEYAWEPHHNYLKTYGTLGADVLLLGMNPGPFGMAQTGVPFGDVTLVRDWMQITGKVSEPQNVHPKRPIEGFDCPRSEVSGTRLWGWAKKHHPEAKDFFKRFFVWNYCPLCFMAETGRNVTPDKLPSSEREALFNRCDDALGDLLKLLKPKHAIGVGKFAEKQIERVIKKQNASIPVGTILHPSPASPAANRGWEPQIERQLKELGIAFEE